MIKRLQGSCRDVQEGREYDDHQIWGAHQASHDLGRRERAHRGIRREYRRAPRPSHPPEDGGGFRGRVGVAGGRSTGAVHEWNALLAESPRNPVFSRCDQREVFQWRIRNVPYPPEVFSVTADPAERKLVIRTANKKYFKRFPVPELDLLGLPLEQHRLQWHHANITLVVSYAKPPAVLAAENEERAQRHAMRGKEEGNVDCKQQ